MIHLLLFLYLKHTNAINIAITMDCTFYLCRYSYWYFCSL